MSTHVVVVSGGPGMEHGVSLRSASCLIAGLRSCGYIVTALVCARDGRWLSPSESEVQIASGIGVETGEFSPLQAMQRWICASDLVFPCMHGQWGEDGCLQGALEILGVPYVGCGVTASSLCLDKASFKHLLAGVGVAHVDAVELSITEYRSQPMRLAHALAQRHETAMIVKPTSGGSSIGVSKATTAEELSSSLEFAFRHDSRVLVEEAITGVRELAVGVVEYGSTLRLSEIAEEINAGRILDFDAKYSATSTVWTEVPAKLPSHIIRDLHDTAERVFRAVRGRGLARIDFFYVEANDELLINEVNTSPGLTTASTFPRQWAASGVPFPELLRNIVTNALGQAR